MIEILEESQKIPLLTAHAVELAIVNRIALFVMGQELRIVFDFIAQNGQ